ncbi:hypothetical protein WJ968_03235 [Achromobacter xylosoxidans]
MDSVRGSGFGTVREAWLGMRSTASVPGRSGEGRSTTAWFGPPAPRLGRPTTAPPRP